MPPVLTHRDVRLDPSSYLLDPLMSLGPRAHQHHAWYRRKFEAYDALGRRAVIPGVW